MVLEVSYESFATKLSPIRGMRFCDRWTMMSQMGFRATKLQGKKSGILTMNSRLVNNSCKQNLKVEIRTFDNAQSVSQSFM